MQFTSCSLGQDLSGLRPDRVRPNLVLNIFAWNQGDASLCEPNYFKSNNELTPVYAAWTASIVA